ncbi:MAG: hypothetical protein R3E95_18160 [Thiolinea sp.]
MVAPNGNTGSGSGSTTTTDNGTTTTVDSRVAALDVTASSRQLNSSGSTPVIITAVAKDSK